MPTVSVIIPTHNRADLILESIHSVFAQTYPDYELIVVDDGSTDNTREMLQPLGDQGRIRYVYQANAGAAAARNRGLEMARGKYVCFLDSDDLFLPAKLERQVAVMEAHPEVGFAQANYAKFDNYGNDLGLRDTRFFSGHIYPQILLYWSTLLSLSCMLIRGSVFDAVGKFDEGMKYAEDLDMWRRVVRRFPVIWMAECLSRARSHVGNMSGDKTAGLFGFRVYLDKAFAEDPSLDRGFRHHALAKMYTNVAQNLVGEGTAEQMPVLRNCVREALRYRPFSWEAYFVWGASLLGERTRKRLIAVWRRRKYGLPAKV